MSRREYAVLQSLMAHEGWKVLEALWLNQLTDIEEGRDRAAKRGQESAWRYWAGQEKGFKVAMMQLKMALAEMETEEDNQKAESRYDQLLDEIKGIKQP